MAHTMNDVARLAGVSPTTVSRVLSKNPHISAATAKRVTAAVEKLRYHRNLHARRLAIGHSDLIGLVISEIANPFFPEIIRGFQSAAWDQGFDVLLLNTEYSKQRNHLVVQKLIENNVRGAAIMTSSLSSSSIQRLTDEGIPVVRSNTPPIGPLVSNITIDYGRGLMQAVEHIAALGHRRTAVIAGPPANRSAASIRKALVQGLHRMGLRPDPVTSSDYNLEAAAAAVKDILRVRDTPTMIFCGSDLIAMGAITALEGAGVEIPRDISLIGIDDISFAFLARPPLTTIRVPREHLGVLAFHAIQRMLESPRKKGIDYVVQTELVVRRSTTPAKSSGLRRKAASISELRLKD